MTATREELSLSIDEAKWEWLRAHLERQSLICVSAELDLAEAGARIAADDTAVVGEWIGSGRLSKPAAEQIREWDDLRDKAFRMLIVSPYILIQEIQTS